MARVNIISQGTEATRPPAGIPNRIYVATDTGKVFVDSGAAWSLFGTVDHTGLTNLSVDAHTQYALSDGTRLKGYRGTSAPASPGPGQLWFDTNTTPPTLRAYDGSTWEILRATPGVGSVTDSEVAVGANIAESKLNLAVDAAANTASRRTLGEGALQAAAGNRSIPAGGLTGQLLAKNSNNDFDFGFANPGGVPTASETVSGTAELASSGEATGAADDTRIMTPLKVEQVLATNTLRLLKTPVSVTGAVSLTSSAFHRLHVASGTTTDYGTQLPPVSASDAGAIVGVRGASSLTRLVTVSASGGSPTIATLRANDFYIFYTDGTTWMVLARSLASNPVLQLNYRAASDLHTAVSLTANTWRSLGPSHTFSVYSPTSTVWISVGGFAQAQQGTGTGIVGSRLLIDGATTYNIGGDLAAANTWVNFLSGVQAVPITGLSVGSHTLQPQVVSNSSNTDLYLRPSSAPPESLYVWVSEHR